MTVARDVRSTGAKVSAIVLGHTGNGNLQNLTLDENTDLLDQIGHIFGQAEHPAHIAVYPASSGPELSS